MNNQLTNIRFDSIKLPKMKKTAEGYLRGEAVVSRSGVFKYQNADGSVRGELRHPEHIFHQDSLQTLKMIPITNDHPPEFVNASNVHKYQVGYTGERYDIDEDKVIVSMTVTHQDAIDAVNSGKLELSLGYCVNLKLEQGNYGGENYDAIQLSPQYNHLALVARGRAGSVARMRFDNACVLITDDVTAAAVQANELTNNTNQMRYQMTNEPTIESMKFEKDQLMTKLSDLQNKLDSVQDELKEERAQKTDASAAIETKVMERVSLINQAMPFLKSTDDLHKKTDRAIMELTIGEMRGDSTDLQDKSDDYVRGVFENSITSLPREHMDKSGIMAGIMLERRNSDSEFNNLNQSLKNQLLNRISK